MPKELSEEEQAARRERRREYNRRYRMARRMQCAQMDICYHCRQPILVRSKRRGWCWDCRNADVQRVRESREAILRTEMAARGKPPACPKCGGANIGRLHKPHDGKAYYCRDCQARRPGAVKPQSGPCPFPCPYCPGGCLRAGFRCGKQRFVCKRCGRANTLLRRNADVVTPPSPRRHQVTFWLGPWDRRDLEIYCRNRSLNVSQGVRQILRQYAYPRPVTLRVRSGVDAWGEPVARVLTRPVEKGPLKFTDTPLPNVRSEALKACWKRKRENDLIRLPYTAYVESQAKVLLDDEAWEGLHRMMRAMGLNHQDTLRKLIHSQILDPKDAEPRPARPGRVRETAKIDWGD